MLNIKAHLNNIAFPHMIFALPFAYMSAFLAAGQMPPLPILFWITVAIFGGRSAALALDNIADYEYDRKQPRLSYRALVRGDITMRDAKISVAVYVVILLVAVLHLRPLCLLLLPFAVLPFAVYPWTKRFTCLCHAVLGLAIAMAPAGAWIATGGEITSELVVLATAVALWIGAFDAVYGAQDENFDRMHGLHSLATAFGAKGALRIARAAHMVSIALFFALGIMLGMSFMYFVGVTIAAAVLYFQHKIVNEKDFSKVTQVYFMRNGIVSVAMFLCAWAAVV